jgi:hypothetical protein
MIRMFTVAAGLVLAGATAFAQSPPETEDARYTFHRTDDGYLRLDGLSGQVSHCVRQSIGWACRALPDDRAALEAEIARLQGENVALKKELIARSLPLPGRVKPAQPGGPDEAPLQLPNGADLNKVTSFLEKAWRRLVEIMGGLQKDLFGTTGPSKS